MTRELIEGQFARLRRRVSARWWMPYAVLAGALAAGVVVSRVPLLRLVGTGARAVNAGLAIASTVAAVDRFLAERPARRKAA